MRAFSTQANTIG